jgi:diguanylate cyclase
MLLPLGVALDNVLIDAGLAMVALVVGFYAALWYCKHSSQFQDGSGGNGTSSEDLEVRENEAARANMAAQQLRDLAKTVASDVGAHHTLMAGITDELGAIDADSPEANASVTNVVSRILTANEKLQSRLADAEKKIEAQAEEIKAHHSEARTDALTKLANRRAFDDALEQNLALRRRERRPFCLLIFDVDHFKQFNDTHGHQAGDEVLRCVGKTLSQVVKVSDVPCRYGGEEFALVMPCTSLAEGRIAAERVRKSIEALSVKFDDKTLQVTISVGIAEAIRGDDSVSLIRRADDAVYASKEAGRNCGHWHDGDDCMPMTVESNPQKQPVEKEKPSAADQGALEVAEQLPDFAAYSDELQRRVAESHRFGVALSSMHIRVDNYASLEQEYGSAVGQLLLDSVAQFIRSSLRDMDLLARMVPGEFAVMLPGSCEREATLVATRIQTAISNCAVPLGGKQVQLLLKIGVSSVEPDDDARSMMRRAQGQTAESPEQEPAFTA